MCPPFERTALRASGLSAAAPRDWRRGDLIELRRSAGGPVPRPAVQDGEAWQEVLLAGARIRFRSGHATPDGTPADPLLRHLVDGDVLATVSRRDPVRRKVAVWTSSNRVFACRSPGLLAALATALADGKQVSHAAAAYLGRPLTGSEPQAIVRAAAQLAELARVEGRPAAMRRPAGLSSAAGTTSPPAVHSAARTLRGAPHDQRNR